MVQDTNRLTIKSWASDDQPREKLLQQGQSTLSNAELIAILIGSGHASESAVELAQRILNASGNDLHELGNISAAELMNFRGIGEAKAVSIMAALELGRRRKDQSYVKKPRIRSSHQAFLEVFDLFENLPHEEFWILMLNRGNRLIARKRISQGGISGTIADTRLIFKHSLEKLASSVILCHNHPSGTLYPSDADVELTKNLMDAGKLLEIKIIDHLIIANGNYMSLSDAGMI